MKLEKEILISNEHNHFFISDTVKVFSVLKCLQIDASQMKFYKSLVYGDES